jgi:membrane protein
MPRVVPRHLARMRWVWSLGGLTAGQLARRVWHAILNEDPFGRAAELSYYFLLSLFPFLIAVISIVGLVLSSDPGLQGEVLRYFGRVMPPNAFDLLRETVSSVTENAGGGKLSFALVLAIWTASLGMEAVIRGLNAAYDISEGRPWWRRKILSIALTVLMLAMVLLALSLTVAGDKIGERLEPHVPAHWLIIAWRIGEWVIPVVFLLVGLCGTYLLAPNLREQRWQAVLPGAAVALAGWVVTWWGLRLYLSYFDSYSRTYGSLGAVIVLLLWLYLSGAAILLGGEVNAQIRNAAAEAGAREAQKITQGE